MIYKNVLLQYYFIRHDTSNTKPAELCHTNYNTLHYFQSLLSHDRPGTHECPYAGKFSLTDVEYPTLSCPERFPMTAQLYSDLLLLFFSKTLSYYTQKKHLKMIFVRT